jgi:IS30 family transposase
LRKSITVDQGKENSEHRALTENTAITVYCNRSRIRPRDLWN